MQSNQLKSATWKIKIVSAVLFIRVNVLIYSLFSVTYSSKVLDQNGILIQTMADLASLVNINCPILSFSSRWIQRDANSQSDLLGVQDLQRKAQRTDSISPHFISLDNISLLIENWLTKVSTLSKYAEFDTQLEQHLGYLDIYATQSLLKGNGSQHRIYEGHNLKRSLSSFQSDSCKRAPKNPTTSAVVITRRDRVTAD